MDTNKKTLPHQVIQPLPLKKKSPLLYPQKKITIPLTPKIISIISKIKPPPHKKNKPP